MRKKNRRADALRRVIIKKNIIKHADGSVLMSAGDTKVICTATVEERVPPFLAGSGRGWVTAEYGMLPASSGQRIPRARAGRTNGRTLEIQRLIGRCLRTVTHLDKIGERTIWIDCDVIQADGGTRVAAITGGYVALVDAINWLKNKGEITGEPLLGSVAAVSVGVVDDVSMLDLCYEEDFAAKVDMNIVLTGDGEYVEL